MTKAKAGVKKVRKPRVLRGKYFYGVGVEDGGIWFTDTAIITEPNMTAKEARRLAAWLNRAADYLEQTNAT